MPTWKRILKWLAWLASGTLVLVVVAYLALLVINWRDAPPSDSARRLEVLYRNRPVVPDADNGYVYVMGFSVAADADPQAAGIRRVAWIRTITPRTRLPSADDPAPGISNYRSDRSASVKQIVKACPADSAKCALALEDGADALPKWLGDEKWLLDRYRTLLHRPGWLETVPLNAAAPLPAYGAVLDGQRLLLAQAYVFAMQKNAVGVRDLLAEDVRFWRHVLASSDFLITKMIAVAALRQHFSFGNLVLRRLPAQIELRGMPQEWTTPMTDEERSMLRVFTGEWIFGDSIIEDRVPVGFSQNLLHVNTFERFFGKLVGLLRLRLFQQQDTSNRRAGMFILAAETTSVPFGKLPASLAQARTILEHPAAGRGAFARLYNPWGKVLLEVDAGAYSSYGVRVADMEGERRAAVLAASLRSRKVDVQRISAELAASEIRAPYDGKPFEWDAGEQAIVFIGLEPKERGRHAFKY